MLDVMKNIPQTTNFSLARLADQDRPLIGAASQQALNSTPVIFYPTDTFAEHSNLQPCSSVVGSFPNSNYADK
jgi:hypothetical protein